MALKKVGGIFDRKLGNKFVNPICRTKPPSEVKRAYLTGNKGTEKNLGPWG